MKRYMEKYEWYKSIGDKVLHPDYMKQYGYKLPKKMRYFVYKTEENDICIIDHSKDKLELYDSNCFIYGQIGYDERTYKYPNYVHSLVWNLIK